jgi:hypothetical protein
MNGGVAMKKAPISHQQLVEKIAGAVARHRKQVVGS